MRDSSLRGKFYEAVFIVDSIFRPETGVKMHIGSLPIGISFFQTTLILKLSEKGYKFNEIDGGLISLLGNGQRLSPIRLGESLCFILWERGK